MQSERKPSNFNWVKARSECSVAAVFTQLLLEATENIAERNRLLRKEEAEFLLTPEEGTRFTVSRRGIPLIGFSLDYDRLSVRTPKHGSHEVTLTFTNDCVCRLKVGDEELDRWQLLRKFLEPVLFA